MRRPVKRRGRGIAAALRGSPEVRAIVDAERAKAEAELRLNRAALAEYEAAFERLVARMQIGGYW